MSRDPELDGRHDFDFFFGKWRTANRKRADPLAEDSTEWLEFEAFIEAHPILGGLGNVDSFSAPAFPGREGFEGMSLRLFAPETGLWRIWWASTYRPGILEPPVIGRFFDGHGQFECDEVMDGRPVKVRFDWKDITTSSATWEQAFSFDEGETWETNWISKHTREA